ncbi:DRTGG domain-containing protein [Halanaerobacter jeridensis]|mgnify:CR=1 FL=1|uniref:Transcriptional regulator n=1 Tax=Halanaerobacter jeridensis TaxID=706427 RepID=A0A938XNR3_9FIRM|nr:DRTGG domain-containing protein [Halanaerobacter jeridensis]MBM7556168.1 putative transcriptional regulator [Halanaerobacter jeridensis]
MKIKKVASELELERVVAGDEAAEVTGVHVGDLLSNVMSRAQAGDLWITIQGHQNVAAIALLTEVAGVVVAEGLDIDDDTIVKAEEKGINLYQSQLSSYQLAGQLYDLGIK